MWLPYEHHETTHFFPEIEHHPTNRFFFGSQECYDGKAECGIRVVWDVSTYERITSDFYKFEYPYCMRCRELLIDKE